MPRSSRRRSISTHALRIDAAAIWQGGIAAGLSFLVAWVIQAI